MTDPDSPGPGRRRTYSGKVTAVIVVAIVVVFVALNVVAERFVR